MKTWLAKFKIYSALDEGRPLPPSLRRRLEDSDDLRSFAQSADALGRALKQDLPTTEPPAFLHASIMRAIEPASQPAPRRSHALRWLPAPVLAIAILLAAWWGLHQPPATSAPRPDLAAASTAVGLGEQVTQTMPAALVSPLSDEWQRLDRDLNKTFDFLSASLP